LKCVLWCVSPPNRCCTRCCRKPIKASRRHTSYSTGFARCRSSRSGRPASFRTIWRAKPL
jgi:hypothetical protein